jgi:hypothetical protein
MTAQGAYNLTSSDGLAANFKLGTTVEVGGSTFMYCKASAAINAYDICIVVRGVTTQGITTTNAGTAVTGQGSGTVTETYTPLVIPQFGVAQDEFFWGLAGPFDLDWQGNSFKVNVLASCAADVVLFTTATAGKLDDTDTNYVIRGLTLTAANGGSTAAVNCKALSPLGVFLQ